VLCLVPAITLGFIILHLYFVRGYNYLQNSLGVPIYEKPPSKYSARRIMKILLSQSIDEQRIAYKRPIEVQSSSIFMVDLTKLAHPDDIKDSYGKWLQKGSHNVYRCSYGKKGEVSIEKAAPGATGHNVYNLRRLHCVHPSHCKFRRHLFVVRLHVCELLSIMMSSLYAIISENSACQCFAPSVTGFHIN
jgi:hypothetical protein